MSHSLKRIISLVIVMSLILSCFPAVSFAKTNDVSNNKQDKIIVEKSIFEISELREESVKHFRLTDGNNIAVQYGMPVHFTDENGTWQNIDNTVIEENSDYVTKDKRIKFSKKITGNNSLFTIHNGNKKIELCQK